MDPSSNVVISFSQAATIRQADDIAAQLGQALAQADSIEIDCSALTEVDFAFIQLIIAARKSAEAAGKRLALSAPARGELLRAVAICGLDDGPQREFWLRGSGG